MRRNLLLSVLSFLFITLGFAQSTATYTVGFESNWSQAAHPNTGGSLPGDAHWSKLVGATHNDAVTFLEMGSVATPGVKNIAETGSNTVFFSEVNAAITANTANNLIEGPSLATALGQMNINNIVTTEEYPLLTLASMIAPSPDWIVAISSLSLIDGDGEWIELFEFDVYPYDAGTDSGTEYTSANQATNPVGVIASAQGTAPFSTEPIGTITITLESVLGLNDTTENNLLITPNPTSGLVSITSSTSIKTIEMYNILGALVVTKQVEGLNTQLDMSGFSSGSYILKITDNQNNKTIKKVLKQ